MVGDGLGMVAGGCGDDAVGSLLRGQQQDFVQRAALLVGASHLQILELQMNILAAGGGERGGMLAGRAPDAFADADAGRTNGGE